MHSPGIFIIEIRAWFIVFPIFPSQSVQTTLAVILVNLPDVRDGEMFSSPMFKS